jgi:uncharacterized phage protein gp47/JayE
MSIADLAFIDNAGFHFPDYPTTLAALQDEYRTIYGADVYLENDSQDGQWIAVNALAIYETLATAAAVYNSFSPLTALADSLSRNVKINGIRRRVATRSTVDVLLTGQAGATISAGIVEDVLGNKWSLPASVLIPVSGQITVTATALELGDTSAAANTVNKISTPTLGWQAVNNPNPATEGVATELDAELRVRQAASTALPSLSVLEGIRGSVLGVSGVSRAVAYENDATAVDANGIPGHSIALVVEGGAAQEIGETIARKKTPGTGTFGTTVVSTLDKYGLPNSINFFRPTIVTIGVEVVLKPLSGYVSNIESLIKKEIADFLNSLPIGSDIYTTKLYVPAQFCDKTAEQTYYVDSLRIKKDALPFGVANIVLAFNEIAKATEAYVTVIALP